MEIPADKRVQFGILMKERMRLFGALVHAREMAMDPVFNRFYRLGIPEEGTLINAQRQRIVTAQTYPLSEIIPKLQERLLKNEEEVNQLMPGM